MAIYAYCETELTCPFCGTFITDMLWFQWGFCAGYAPRQGNIYHLQDSIYWKACQDGSIPSWSYFEEGGGNIGTPSIQNLYVRDSGQTWLNGSCPHCSQSIGGAAIAIRDGIITKAWMYAPHELDNEVDIYLLTTAGSLKLMPEWNDHPMTIIPYNRTDVWEPAVLDRFKDDYFLVTP